MWGNPYFKLVRSQLERFIIEELGADYLSQEKNKTELRVIKKEISALKKRLGELEARKKIVEQMIT